MARKINGPMFPDVNPSTLQFHGGDPSCDHDYPVDSRDPQPGVYETEMRDGRRFHKFFCATCGGYLEGEDTGIFSG